MRLCHIQTYYRLTCLPSYFDGIRLRIISRHEFQRYAKLIRGFSWQGLPA